jgi:hypothetical protein
MGSASITVELVESEGNLTGLFGTSCGPFTLRGSVQGTSISGILDGPEGPGTISAGQLSANRIQFGATVHIEYDGDFDADDTMVERVDLSRP